MFSGEGDGMYRARREAFAVSLLGQAVLVALLVYFLSIVIRGPNIGEALPRMQDLPLIFSGFTGGGGGNHDPLPASHGNPPRASLDPQLAPPTVIVPKEMPKLAVPETIIMAPDVTLPQGGQIGDPMSKFSILSDGPGGPGGISTGCCDGVGPSTGPHYGPGPEGIFQPGMRAKHQGIVQLLVVVGKDGHPYDIRVGQTLGMGLDEKAIEAVSRWRFRPATFNGQPVATQIAIQVDFHLY
jgi:TonB family protein